MSPLQSGTTQTEILLVEDNPGDTRLIEEAFDEIDREIELHTVADGYGAVRFLKQRGAADPPSLPDLVLLDLNIPGKDGCEVLETIRADPQLRSLPVLMLTSSDRSKDVARCYDACTNAYVTKPTNLGEYVSMIEAIDRFWFENVQFPPIPQ